MLTEKYVMIADDDDDDRLLFEEALREVCKKSKLISAIDGLDLINTLEKTYPPAPDVIFLDINMPRLNGFECLIQIKANSNFKNIPIVIFSTSSTEENIDLAFSNGANYYIQKPASFSGLKKIIEKVYTSVSASLQGVPSRKDFVITV